MCVTTCTYVASPVWLYNIVTTVKSYDELLQKVKIDHYVLQNRVTQNNKQEGPKGPRSLTWGKGQGSR